MYPTSSPQPAPPPVPVLQARKLAAKGRDLQEWEESLTKRQEMYEGAAGSAEVRLKTLTAKVEAKEEELAKLEKKLTSRTKTVSEELQKLDKVMERAKEGEKAASQKREVALEKAHKALDQVDTASGRLMGIEREIKDRKAYQQDQETLIDQTAQAGNDKLASINREIKRFEVEQENLLVKIHESTAKVKTLEDDISERGEDLARLDARYEEAAREYRIKLAEVKLAIGEEEIQRDRIVAETDQKLLDLKAERAEIEVAREVITKQREEVMGEKRQLDSMKTMYGL